MIVVVSSVLSRKETHVIIVSFLRALGLVNVTLQKFNLVHFDFVVLVRHLVLSDVVATDHLAVVAASSYKLGLMGLLLAKVFI